jgi:hypothetical protein
MPLKLSVGLSRKQGLPNFGSAGATCLVELELASDALKESASFFEQAENALEACRAVVEAELARQAQPVSASPSMALRYTVGLNSISSPTVGQPSQLAGAREAPATRDRPTERPAERPATSRQLQAIERLSLRLGAEPGEWLYERIGDTPPHCLSVAEASALIDELQQHLPPRMAG